METSFLKPKNDEDISSPSYFALVLKDEEVARWMTINNTFIKEGAFGIEDFWSGVMFQLGEAVVHGAGNPKPALTKVNISRFGEQTVSIGRDEFKSAKPGIWINIIAGFRNLDPDDYFPMHREHLDLLFPRETNGPKALSLHKYFQPYNRGITLWQEPAGVFELQVNKNVKHNGFTFAVRRGEKFTVEVWDRGGSKSNPEVYNDAKSIVLETEGGGDPGDGQNPPQRGGQ